MPRLPTNVVYLVAGSGPMTPVIEQKARDSGIEGRVVLLGRVSESELAALYSGADLFVMPNIHVTGDIDITDPLYTLRYLFHGGPPPDAPFPDCGAGSTVDEESGCESYPACE